MALYLEVIQGESQGAKFPLRDGYRLGRTTGEILIPDRKISSLHAQIETQDGRLVLVDRGSSNGLLISNQRVNSIVLAPGVKFTVGKSQVQVIELSEDFESTKFTNLPAEEGAGLAAPIAKGWKEILAEQIPILLMQNYGTLINIQPFQPALKLEFIRGPETDRVVLLGYGPRKFGSNVLDIELMDRLAPFLAFEIIPDGNQARIKTKEFETVQLNKKRFSDEILKSGDLIQVGNTTIKVSTHQEDQA